MIGRPELADDPRYATLHDAHPAPRGALRARRRAPRHRHDRGVVRALPRGRDPAAPVQLASTTCSTTSTSVPSGLFEEVDHPTEGRLLQCVTPITIDGHAGGQRRPAPLLGADTDAVLRRGAATADETGEAPSRSPSGIELKVVGVLAQPLVDRREVVGDHGRRNRWTGRARHRRRRTSPCVGDKRACSCVRSIGACEATSTTFARRRRHRRRRGVARSRRRTRSARGSVASSARAKRNDG